MEKGILTSEQEKQLAVIVDEALDLKNKLLELIDGFVFKALISTLDNKVLDKIREDIKSQLAELVDAILEEDLSLAEAICAQIINKLVDVPALEEADEELIFKGAIELIIGAVMKWIKSKK